MSVTPSPGFDYADPKTIQQQQDLEAQAENVINSHIADLDYEQENVDDDEQIIHYSTVIPQQNEAGEMEKDGVEVRRSILPARRRKLLNLRYITRLRGLVKLSQTVRIFPKAFCYQSILDLGNHVIHCYPIRS